MRWCALLLVVLIISPTVNALVLPSDINPGSANFYSKTKIKSAASKFRYKSIGAQDYIFKGAVYAVEFFVLSRIGVKIANTNALKALIGAGLTRLGMTRTGVSVSKKIATPILKKAPLKGLNDALSVNKYLSSFIVGLIKKRPTPSGLKLGSKTAIEMAAESYYFTASKTSPNNPHLLSAEKHLQAASDEYNSYTGFLDAFTLTYSKFSPEGYDKILSECLLAIDDLNLAKKQKNEISIATG